MLIPTLPTGTVSISSPLSLLSGEAGGASPILEHGPPRVRSDSRLFQQPCMGAPSGWGWRQVLRAETALTQQSGGTQSLSDVKAGACLVPLLCSALLFSQHPLLFFLFRHPQWIPRQAESGFQFVSLAALPSYNKHCVSFSCCKLAELCLLCSGLSGLHGHLLWCLLPGIPPLVWKSLHYDRHSLHLV